MIPMLNPWQKK